MNREEAIEIVRKLYYDSLFLKKDKEAIETLIPELKESEDERIRKTIFKALSKKDARDVLLANGVQVSDALSWLEKQGEQKHDWSEDDEEMRKKLLFLMEEENNISSWEGCYEWLKSIMH